MENLALDSHFSLLDKLGKCECPKDLQILTGFEWNQIVEIKNMFITLRDTDNRTITQALIVFLIKLRTGNSNRLIAFMLQLKNEQLVSEYSNTVLRAFKKHILPTRFGLDSVNRNGLILNHTSHIALNLFHSHEELILICDITYMRPQKKFQ